MGKSNKDIEREKFIKKFLLVMIPLQILMIFLFVYAFNLPDELNLEECISDVIIVDKKEKEFALRDEEYFFIYSNGVKYQYLNYGIFAKYSGNEFFKAIEEGQQLNIIYRKTRDPDSTLKILVEVKSEDETYLDFEESKSRTESDKTISIIFVSVLELLILAAAAFTIYAKYSELKFFGRRKKKKKKKVEKTE